MNLLFLTPQLPYPPRQGATIRNFNLIQRLAQRHVVDLFTFLAPGESLEPTNPLHALCRRIATVRQPQRSLARRAADTLFSPLPDMALRLASPAMDALIDQTAAEAYDLVQIEGIEMAPYGLRLVRRRTQDSRPALAFDDHNCEYLLQKRNALSDLRTPSRWIGAAYSFVQWHKLRRYERHSANAADLAVAVSEPDAEALARIGIRSRIAVVPNGINAAAYAALCHSAPVPDTLLFLGKMDYRPNVDAALWFAQEALPMIQSRASAVRLQIVGQNPHPRLDVLRGNPAIDITGTVPEIEPYLAAAAVFVIPMRVGGGTRLKALEAMAACKPIVSTSLGVEGIDVAHGRELLIADTPVAFAQAVLELLDDQQRGVGVLSKRLTENARRFVAERYDWDNLVPLLERAYAELGLSSH
jgi:glycosyltransferase involved in cell wall biosynthesis